MHVLCIVYIFMIIFIVTFQSEQECALCLWPTQRRSYIGLSLWSPLQHASSPWEGDIVNTLRNAIYDLQRGVI